MAEAMVICIKNNLREIVYLDCPCFYASTVKRILVHAYSPMPSTTQLPCIIQVPRPTPHLTLYLDLASSPDNKPHYGTKAHSAVPCPPPPPPWHRSPLNRPFLPRTLPADFPLRQLISHALTSSLSRRCAALAPSSLTHAILGILIGILPARGHDLSCGIYSNGGDSRGKLLHYKQCCRSHEQREADATSNSTRRRGPARPARPRPRHAIRSLYSP